MSPPVPAGRPDSSIFRPRLGRAGLILATLVTVAACGSSAGDTVPPTTLASSPSPTTSTTAASPAEPTTTTTIAPLDETCRDGAVGTEARVVGVVDYVRIRQGPTTASDEIGRLAAGSTVTVFVDELTYDGSQYWWVPVRIPAAGTCGSVAAAFLADESGRLDQQLPGVTFAAPVTGEWTFTDRTSLRDPIEGALDGAFFTTYSVMVADGRLIDEILADQLAEFEEFEYEYPPDWYEEVPIPGSDRAVRLIPVGSPSGDLLINRLLIEVGEKTLEAATAVYIEDLEQAPLEELEAFLDSIEIDRPRFLGTISP